MNAVTRPSIARTVATACVAAGVAGVALTGCQALPGGATGPGTSPSTPTAPSAPSAAATALTLDQAPVEGTLPDSISRPLGDGLTVAAGTRLVGAVGTLENRTADGWYATLLLTKKTNPGAVLDEYRRQLTAAGFTLRPTAGDRMRGDRGHDASGFSGASTATVDLVAGSGPVPGHVRVIVTTRR